MSKNEPIRGTYTTGLVSQLAMEGAREIRCTDKRFKNFGQITYQNRHLRRQRAKAFLRSVK